MSRTSAQDIAPPHRFSSTPRAYAAAPASVSDSFDLARLGQFLRRHTVLIASTTAVALALGIVFYLGGPTKYRAVAELLIDPHGLAVSKLDTTTQVQGADSDLLDLETQRYLILSKAVLGSVIDSEHLDANPRFVKPSAFEKLFNFSKKPVDAREAALTKLIDSVEVVRGERALILDVVVTTSDAELSAGIANAISRAFFTQQNIAHNEAANRAGLALRSRAEQLAQQMQEAETKVERYKSDHDLSGQDGKFTAELQLNDINYQLGLARSQTATQRARYQETARLSHAGAEIYKLSEAEASPVLISLRAQYATLVQQKSALDMQLGPQHPALFDVNHQLNDVTRLIREELSHLVGVALSDFHRAQAKEAALEERLADLKQKSFRLNEALVGLRALERGVAATRAAYQSLLTRANGLEETQEVDGSTSRIITEATPNLKRSGTPLPLILSGALLCGLGLGSSLGYVRDLGDGKNVRSAVEECLGMPVIAEAVLPCADAPTRVVTHFRKETPIRECGHVDRILDWILAIPNRRGPRVVFVAGLEGDPRKSRIIFEVGAAVFLDRRRALLLDGDLNGSKTSRYWRVAGDSFVEEMRGVRFLKPVFDDFKTGCAVYGEGERALEFLSLRKIFEAERRQPTSKGLENVMQPWMGDVDLVLISADLDSELGRACLDISHGLIVLVDSDRARAANLINLSRRLGSERPTAAGAMLVGERAVA